MEKDRSTKIFAMVAMFVAVIGASIGFAAFATTLNIQGTADVKASKWEIKFSNLQEVAKVGSAYEKTAPTIQGDTTIGDYSVGLVKPGDSITYTFDVVNNGTFDASISSLVKNQISCTSTSVNEQAKATDEANVCNNVSYKLTYSDGAEVRETDTLAKNETKTMKLSLTYLASTTAAQLPSNDVAISNLGISIVYSQK